jgi:hypothetical protein
MCMLSVAYSGSVYVHVTGIIQHPRVLIPEHLVRLPDLSVSVSAPTISDIIERTASIPHRTNTRHIHMMQY